MNWETTDKIILYARNTESKDTPGAFRKPMSIISNRYALEGRSGDGRVVLFIV